MNLDYTLTKVKYLFSQFLIVIENSQHLPTLCLTPLHLPSTTVILIKQYKVVDVLGLVESKSARLRICAICKIYCV